MGKQETAPEIDDQAARWAARIDAAGEGGSLSTELDGWLAGDPRRRGALLRAEAALSLLDRGRALSGVIPRPERPSLLTRRRLLYAGAGLAAAAAGITTLVVLPIRSRRYSTELGEVRRVQLPDGSVAAINTLSVVEIDMRETLRTIDIKRGEAWFQVAKDKTRPFLVSAGSVRVRAVGTAFSVRRRDDGADVLVTEGTVETWVVGEEQALSRLTAGSKAFVADYAPPKPVTGAAEIERTLAWRDGQISLEGETLADAVAEFNRYNSRKLIIADPELAQEKLVGQFSTSEPNAFARAVQSTLGANISEDANSIRLSRRALP